LLRAALTRGVAARSALSGGDEGMEELLRAAAEDSSPELRAKVRLRRRVC
jgi:hypothetical protein